MADPPWFRDPIVRPSGNVGMPQFAPPQQQSAGQLYLGPDGRTVFRMGTGGQMIPLPEKVQQRMGYGGGGGGGGGGVGVQYGKPGDVPPAAQMRRSDGSIVEGYYTPGPRGPVFHEFPDSLQAKPPLPQGWQANVGGEQPDGTYGYYDNSHKWHPIDRPNKKAEEEAWKVVTEEGQALRPLSQRIATLQQMEAALELGAKPGAFAPWQLKAKQALMALNPDWEKQFGQDVALNRLFQALGNDLASHMYVAGTGQVSNYETKLFLDKVPQLSDDPVTARTMLRGMQQGAAFTKRYHQARRDWLEKHRTLRGWEDHVEATPELRHVYRTVTDDDDGIKVFDGLKIGDVYMSPAADGGMAFHTKTRERPKPQRQQQQQPAAVPVRPQIGLQGFLPPPTVPETEEDTR